MLNSVSLGLAVAVIMTFVLLGGPRTAHPAELDIRFGFMPTGPRVNPDAKIIHRIPDEDNPAWLAYCQPREYLDRYGVTRFHYAHDGCGFGITGPRDIDR